MYWTRTIGLIAVLIEHGRWWRSGGREGVRADLGGADLGGADLRGADLRSADLGGASLRSADLRGADLRGANLCDANLRSANVCDADLGGANLGGAGIPVVPNVHQRTLDAIENGGSLDMANWHGRDDNACGTTHCRAGWAIYLAGGPGLALENAVGPSLAGALIIQASCPWIDRVPDFMASDADALADIKARAAEERALEVTT